MAECTNCDATVEDTARFCQSCGAAFVNEIPDPVPAGDPLPASLGFVSSAVRPRRRRHRRATALTDPELQAAALTAGAAGLAIAIGSLMSWVDVVGLINTSVAGTHGDGTYTLALGMGLIGLAVVIWVPANLPPLIALAGVLVLSLAAGCVAVYDSHHIASVQAVALAQFSIGPGLYVVGIGSGLGVVSAAVLASRMAGRRK